MHPRAYATPRTHKRTATAPHALQLPQPPPLSRTHCQCLFHTTVAPGFLDATTRTAAQAHDPSPHPHTLTTATSANRSTATTCARSVRPSCVAASSGRRSRSAPATTCAAVNTYPSGS
eukprot:255636-Chlamydomonas_euryale.AAC.1